MSPEVSSSIYILCSQKRPSRVGVKTRSLPEFRLFPLPSTLSRMDPSFDPSAFDPTVASIDEIQRYCQGLDECDAFEHANLAAPPGWAFTPAWAKLITWSWRDLCEATRCGTGGDLAETGKRALAAAFALCFWSSCFKQQVHAAHAFGAPPRLLNRRLPAVRQFLTGKSAVTYCLAPHPIHHPEGFPTPPLPMPDAQAGGDAEVAARSKREREWHADNQAARRARVRAAAEAGDAMANATMDKEKVRGQTRRETRSRDWLGIGAELARRRQNHRYGLLPSIRLPRKSLHAPQTSEHNPDEPANEPMPASAPHPPLLTTGSWWQQQDTQRPLPMAWPEVCAPHWPLPAAWPEVCAPPSQTASQAPLLTTSDEPLPDGTDEVPARFPAVPPSEAMPLPPGVTQCTAITCIGRRCRVTSKHRVIGAPLKGGKAFCKEHMRRLPYSNPRPIPTTGQAIPKPTDRCKKCKQLGHWRAHCPNEWTAGPCALCGAIGHFAYACTHPRP
jgi:hypothetical protein